MFKQQIIGSASLVLLAVGCVTELGDEDIAEVEELGETEQAFSANWSYSWGDTKVSKADIGTAVNRACFMSGVAGYLTTNQFPEGSSQNGAGVTINPVTNHYEIYVDPAFNGVTLQTWARCVNTTSLTAEATWTTGQPKKLIAPVTANRRCFLTKLTTGRDSTYSHGGFQSVFDGVWINNDGSNWYVQGSQSGRVWASARCIDVTQDLGEFFGWAIQGSTNTVPLVQATSGATCFLTQVSGQINVGNDWVQGPFISYNAGYNFFDFNLKNGTGGRARCVR